MSMPLIRILFTAGMLALWSAPSLAEDFHWEFAGGLSKFGSASTFFPTSPSAATANPGFGYAAALTLGYNASPVRAPVRFVFGIQHRYSSGKDASGRYVLQATYPIIRIVTQEFFITLGGTPFHWGSAGTGSILGLDERSPSGFATLLGEVGYLIPLTPEISFGFSGASRFAYYQGSISGKPLMEGMLLFRFHHGKGGNRLASDPSAPTNWDDFEGWRYPYGWYKK